jgi:hypothetical protein
MEIVELTDLEKAKQLIADEEARIVNEAAKEFNEFIEKWAEKHKCSLAPFGTFLGGEIQTGIKVIKNK